MRVKPLTITGAEIWRSPFPDTLKGRTLHTTDQVITEAYPRATRIDLEGYTIFPGLVNAHDHLELNHYPRTKYREKYDNAHQWGEEVNARLNDSPFTELRAYPLEDRCFIGGLKNLLCGALTVIHHNPPHKPLFKRDFPVRVLKHYQWAHSLRFASEHEIISACRTARKTRDQRFFIHLAEGTDEQARREYQQLKQIGGVIPSRTVLIHGVGLTEQDLQLAAEDFISGVVWCPSTNLFLLGSTIDLSQFESAPVNALAIGSDSRLTADGDFLDEMRAAYTEIQAQGMPNALLYRMVVLDGAFLTGIKALYGFFEPGSPADWIAYPIGHDLYQLHRADLSLIVRGGVPQIGDPAVMAKFPYIETVEARLDGVPKLINIDLARQISRCSLQEPGLELLQNLRDGVHW